MKPLAVCLILACFAAPGRAQAPTKPPAAAADADAQTRYVLDVFRVNLLFTVTDRRGRFVSGLTENDFQVFEGKTPQKIVSFTAEGNLPLRLAILVDSSNSIRERLRFIQESAIEFINSVLRPGQDRAAVISFDTAPELQVDLTDNIERLTRVIRNLRAGGGTSMYDAIYFAARDRLGQEEGRDKLSAVREAAVTRLRPILMTSVATVFGHLPLTLVTGPGAHARNSIGLVLVAAVPWFSIGFLKV